MRLHFAAELILEIVVQNFGFKKVGAHISEEKSRIDFISKSRIDFISDSNIASLFETIIEKYNSIIRADKAIQTEFSNVEIQRRFWKIEGFAEVPCGGTPC